MESRNEARLLTWEQAREQIALQRLPDFQAVLPAAQPHNYCVMTAAQQILEEAERRVLWAVAQLAWCMLVLALHMIVRHRSVGLQVHAFLTH